MNKTERDNTQLGYKFKIGYNYIISGGDKVYEVEIAANNPASKVRIAYKSPNDNNINLGLAIDLMIHHNINIELDTQYAIGEHAQEYGGTLIVRYIF